MPNECRYLINNVLSRRKYTALSRPNIGEWWISKRVLMRVIHLCIVNILTVLGYRKVVYKSRTWIRSRTQIEATLSPNFQAAHQPHWNRSHSLKKAAQCRWCRTKFYRFSHAKCLLTLEIILEQSQCQVSLLFSCARPLLRVLQTLRTLHKPPSNKSHPWIEAATKIWKIAH